MTEADVRVRRARVTGLRERGSLDAWLRRLERTRLPEVDPRRTVIIRRVAVQVHSHNFEQVLGAALDLALRAAWELQPGSIPPESASAVAFADPARRLACLACDLARGRAATTDAWWWSASNVDVNGPPARAIARAWQDEPRWLPAVVAELARAQQLTLVWAALDASACEQLLLSLATAHSAPRLHSAVPAASLSAAARAAPPSVPPSDHTASVHGLVWPASQLARWSPVLARLPVSDLRVRLAAALAALESAANLLHGTQEAFLAWQLAAPAAQRRGSAPASDPPVPESSRALANPGPRKTPGPPKSSPSPQSNAASPRVSNAGIELPTPARSAAFGTEPVSSAYASAVFVLNALAQPALREAWPQATQRHGFAWWQALCIDLGLAPDDPLSMLLTDTLSQLSEQAPPSEEARAHFHALAREHYGECWNDALIQIPGTIQLGATHLDVWLPMSSLRTELRLAGLDLNPGWLPWLGRVATIHYVANPEPASC